MGATILAALLAMFPHMNHAACVRARVDAIAATADEAFDDAGVPPAVLLVVGLFESHWGCHPASGGCWGAPIDVRHRLTAGTPMHAARALARSRAVCGDWTGAIGRFRSGLCAPWKPEHRAYVSRAVGLVRRVDPSLDLPAPRW